MRRPGLRRLLGLSALVVAAVAAAGPAGAAVSKAQTAAVGGSRAVIRLSANSLTVGQRLTATVVVLPRSAGRVVLLQRRGASHWRNLAQGVTDATGKVVFHVTLKMPDTYHIRGDAPATATAAEAVSPSDALTLSPVPPPYAGTTLVPGDSGSQVVALQQRLSSLGYWLGTPGGNFGDATEQAVYAFQKAAGLPPTGSVGASTVAALQTGALPHPRSKTGYVIEIDLKIDLIMFVQNGKVLHTLNTSTGGGYTYTEDGATDVATTPTGVFHINRTVNGLVVDSLGALWRPRFFYEGYAIHGDSYVPPVAVSHGCARVSNEAIDWIWANNIAPAGTEVWVY